MAEMPLISVIVPVYKVEEYLNKCVDSILTQTYRKLEIILVDDGSPDNCPTICDEYAKCDRRVIVIHKENGGLSDARNAGIEIARGEYIGFVDSDDCILPDMYEKLYNALKMNDADMSICNYLKVDKNGSVRYSDRKSHMKTEVITPKEAMEKLFEEHIGCYVTVWNKLYNRNILENLRFEKGRLHEDEFFVHHAFGKCKKIACIEDGCYLYLQRNDSIMGNEFGIRRLDAGIAMLDRYFFFKDEYPTLAKRQAVRVYAGAVAALKREHFRKLSDDYQKMVKNAFDVLYREKDLRYVKLLLFKLMHL